MMVDRWHLITGEYPPNPGGVADYTARLAAAMAEAGSEIHVWTSQSPDAVHLADSAGVTVHRPVTGWSRADLDRMDAELDADPMPRRLLIQHTPNVWGYKGLNLGFCRWLLRRKKRGDDVRIMFHEVWYPWQLRDKPTRWLLALGHRLMTRTLMDACSVAYVSIPSWEPLLRTVARNGPRPIAWLPVPSTIAVVKDDRAVLALRSQVAPTNQKIIGSFGTFGDMIGGMLSRMIPSLLERDANRMVLLLGRGSERFAARLVAEYPQLACQLIAKGELSPAEVSIHLQACDVLIQPYPDGLSSRRTTLMAGLAHGVATVSNLGALSEPVWARAKCVALATAADPVEVTEAAESILSNPARCVELGLAGRDLYQREFAIERTVEVLKGLTADLINR